MLTKYWQSYLLPLSIIAMVSFVPVRELNVQAQTNRPNNAMTVRSDRQEANSETGVITATGNVQINYPLQKLQATANQAQYFSKEKRLVLTGNVYVLQDGNSIRAENLTYLMEEGRFIATPQNNRQVESTYIVPENTQFVPQGNKK